MNWKTIRLKSAVTILSGFAFKSELFNTEGIGMPIIRIRDVVPGYSETYYDGPYDGKYVVQDGDFLIGMDGEFNIARWKGGPALLNQRVCKIEQVNDAILDRGYLAYFLVPELKNIEDLTPFVTVKHLSVKTLEAIEIPLPPLAEQQRIATILDQADALRTKRRAALAKLDTLLQATFLHMFGDPVTNPLGWEVVKLSEISDVDNGVTKSSSRIKGKDTVTLPYMRVANVQDGKILTGQDDVKTIEVLREDAEKYLLKPDDILLTEGGDPDKLGRGGIWKGEIDPCIHQNHIFRVRISDNDFLPEYISALIGSLYGKNYFLKAAKQTTGIATINKTQLCAFPIQRASIDLQYRFRQFVKKLEVQKSSLEVSNHELDNLFHSLQQRAFKGEL